MNIELIDDIDFCISMLEKLLLDTNTPTIIAYSRIEFMIETLNKMKVVGGKHNE